MKKLTLLTEHLGELTTDELARVAGAARGAEAPNTVSDGSCGCTIRIPFAIFGSCDISDGSCGCFCDMIEATA